MSANMDQLPQQFFTAERLATLAGVSGATFAVTNGMAYAFGWSPRWLGLVVAEVICITFAWPAAVWPSGFLIAFLNGFLVFCTAAGMSGGIERLRTGPETRADARAGNVAGHEKPEEQKYRRWPVAGSKGLYCLYW